MRWLLCAAVLAWPAGATAEPRGLVVLSSARDRGREVVLVDALRIYMRDVGRAVRLGGAAPATADVRELERVADEGRRAGAEVVVWFGERGAAPVLYALRVATLELRETPVEPDDPLLAARTAALKVRALLSARPDESTWSVSPETPPPPIAPPPAATPPVAQRPVEPPSAAPDDAPLENPARAVEPAPPAPAPPPSTETPRAESRKATTAVRAAPPARAPRRAWVEATVAYGATLPTAIAWVRHGLTLRFAVPFSRLPLAAFADAAFTTEPSAIFDGSSVAARVWPVGAGVAYRLRRPRWQLSVGPRVSLQIVDANAVSPAGRAGAARRYSAGLGALGEFAWLFSRHFAAVAAVGAEALVPRLEFGAGPGRTTDLGWVQFNFTAGVLVSIP